MSGYDIQVVCKNGHQLTDALSYAGRPIEFCDQCGERGISRCPNCNAPIPGDYHADGVLSVGGDTPIPLNCAKCGAAFPWKDALTKQRGDASAAPPTLRLERLLRRFHHCVRELRQRHADRTTLDIADEYDVQDLLGALLRLEFDDVRREEWTPSYAGGSSRMDFLLHPEQVVVEAKFARKGHADKQIGAELLIDLARYKKHSECKALVCFIYDPDGYLRNPAGLVRDLESEQAALAVSVIVSPPP